MQTETVSSLRMCSGCEEDLAEYGNYCMFCEAARREFAARYDNQVSGVMICRFVVGGMLLLCAALGAGWVTWMFQ